MKMTNTPKTNTQLTTFIGVFVDALLKEGYQASEVKRIVSQDLINEALVLCNKEEEKSYDYYALQSLFLSVSYVLKRELDKMRENAHIQQVSDEMDRINFVVNYLENRVRMVNKKC